MSLPTGFTNQNGKILVKVKGVWLHQNGYYYWSRMRARKKITVSLETKDYEEAVLKAMKLLRTEPAKISTDTLDGEIKHFIAEKVRLRKFSRFSAAEKRRTLLRFAKWHGLTLPARTVTADVIRKYQLYLQQDLKLLPSTITGYMMCLSSFFTALHTEKKIPENPVKLVDLGKRDYGARTSKAAPATEAFCQPKLRDALLDGWNKVPEKLMSKDTARMLSFVLHVGFEAGLRRNEIIEARPDWFFVDGKKTIMVRKTATFTPKWGKVRSIAMTDLLADFLRDYLKDHQGEWCIAPHSRRGKNKYRFEFIKPFKQYMAFMGERLGQDLSWITVHTMRHTFASLLAGSGQSLYKISKWLGDSETVVANHYAHLQSDDQTINSLRSEVTPLNVVVKNSEA